jgi:hypothetical protein
MEHLSEKEWFPMATLPIEQALAYLDALEADRMAAFALSEQKAEEAKLIKARQEGFRAALKAHPVVPGSSTYRGGGRNLKRGWVSSFRVP